MRIFILNALIYVGLVCFNIGAFKLAEWAGYFALCATAAFIVVVNAFGEKIK